MLKTKQQLKDVDDNEEDIFQSSIVDRYMLRPTTLESLCLAEFAANYTVNYNEDFGTLDDSVLLILDDIEDENDNVRRLHLPKKIKLKDGNRTMHKRSKEAVIRFRKISRDKDPSNFFRSKLMLYFPWRTERVDLLGHFDSFADHYNDVVKIVKKKEKLYTSNIEDIEQMLDDNEQNGLPEHIWAQVAPGTEHMDRQDRNQPLEININIENEDLVANAVMFENQTCHPTSDVALRYDK